MHSPAQIRSLLSIGHLLAGLLCIGLVSRVARADYGQPLAVRYWESGVVSIETQWDFEIVVHGQDDLPLPEALQDADLLVAIDDGHCELTHHAQTMSATDRQSTTHRVARAELDHFLDRLPNHPASTLTAASDATFVSPNAVHLAQRSGDLLVLAIDGVRLAVLWPRPAGAQAKAGMPAAWRDGPQTLARQSGPWLTSDPLHG